MAHTCPDCSETCECQAGDISDRNCEHCDDGYPYDDEDGPDDEPDDEEDW